MICILFRSKYCFHPNAGRQYGDAILLRKRNFFKYWRILQEVQRRRDSEIEGRTFSKDDENGALRELSRFVTLKDFEGNKHYILSRFRSNEFFNFVFPNIDDFDQNAISILLHVNNEKSS